MLMALSVKTIGTGPAIEPVSLGDAKQHLRGAWDDDDASITAMISAARIWLEHGTGRALITRTLRATFDHPLESDARGGVGGVVLPYGRFAYDLPYALPLQAVSLVEIEQDVTTWKTLALTADYVVDSDSEPARVWMHSSALANWMPSWDWTGALAPRVRITYTAGYGTTVG